jgi:hypothetical protein
MTLHFNVTLTTCRRHIKIAPDVTAVRFTSADHDYHPLSVQLAGGIILNARRSFSV